MSSKQIIVWESAADGWALKQNNMNLHIARSFRLSNGILDTNLVWQCKPIGPRRRTISWIPKYGMAWTYKLLESGSMRCLRVNGPWQAFDLSESFDIFPNGTWRVSSSAGRAGWLSIGANTFYPKNGQLHIVIGVWNNASRCFNPIYVDTTSLACGQGTSYQPQESATLWFDVNSLSQVRISATGSARGHIHLTEYENYATATYLAEQEIWEFSEDVPPPATSTGLFGGLSPGASARVSRAAQTC